MLIFAPLSEIKSLLLTKHILNNMIKKLLFPALVGAMTMFAACESDPCKDLDGKCGTGTCFEGACVCDEGYEADAEGICNVKWTTKFVGSYGGSDVTTSNIAGSGNAGTFTLQQDCVVKELTDNVKQVEIYNLGGFQVNIVANIVRASATDESATVLEFNNYTDASGDVWNGTLTYDAAAKTLGGTYVLEDKVTGGAGETLTSTISYNKK